MDSTFLLPEHCTNLNAIIIHDRKIGAASIWSSRFLPKQPAKYPAGIAPKHAPKVISEPIQEPSSSDIGLIAVGLWSIGIADDVHDKQAPMAKALNVAEILVIHSKVTCLSNDFQAQTRINENIGDS